jgi:hypothetical protein
MVAWVAPAVVVQTVRVHMLVLQAHWVDLPVLEVRQKRED